MGSGRRLRYSIHKYGKQNHTKEILEFLENREALKNREYQLINEDLLNDKMCMNLQPGGGGGLCNSDHEIKLHKGATDWLLKKWKDPEYREDQSKRSSVRLQKSHTKGKIKYDTFVGKNHTAETKDKIGSMNSIKQKGSNNSQFGTVWVSNDCSTKKIKSDQLEQYLQNGWHAGRK